MSHIDEFGQPKNAPHNERPKDLGHASISRPHVRTATQTKSQTQSSSPFSTHCVTSVSSVSYTYPPPPHTSEPDCGCLPTLSLAYPNPQYREPPMGALLPPIQTMDPCRCGECVPSAHIEEVEEEEEPTLPPPPEPRRRTIIDLCQPTPPPQTTSQVIQPVPSNAPQPQQKLDTKTLSNLMRTLDSSIHQLDDMMSSIPINSLTKEHFDLIMQLNRSTGELFQHWRRRID